MAKNTSMEKDMGVYEFKGSEHLSDFKSSGAFSKDNEGPTSSLEQLITNHSTSNTWSRGAITAYSNAVKSMVQGNVGTMKKIGEILGEPEKVVEWLYGLVPNSLKD